MPITPMELEVLMHHYVSPTKFMRIDTIAYKEAIKKWQKEGFVQIEPDAESMIATTKEGEEYICRLLNTELHLPRAVAKD